MKNAGRYTNEEAQSLLTLGEANAIQRHYDREIGAGLFGMELAAGLIWAFERRGALAEGEKLTSWADIDAIALKDIEHYFKPDEIELDPADPETDSGKGLSSAV